MPLKLQITLSNVQNKQQSKQIVDIIFIHHSLALVFLLIKKYCILSMIVIH